MASGSGVIAVLDFSTSGGKCVLFDAQGRCLAAAREAWTYDPYLHEHSALAAGWSFAPDRFWAALVRSTRAALRQAGLPGEAICAVTASSLRIGTVLLDGAGRELFCAPNVDVSGLAGGFEIMARLEEARGNEITGHWPPWIWSLARLLAFHGRHPEQTVAAVLTPLDWITWRLCGALVTEPSIQGPTGLLDVSRANWSDEICDLFDLDRSLLPKLVPGGSRAGELSPAAAADLGLRPGTPVHVGGADSQCALLGSGVRTAEDCGAVLGTTAPLMRVDARPRVTASGPLWTGTHVLPGLWVRESNAGEAGAVWDWLLDLTGFELPGDFERAERLVGPLARAPSAIVGFSGPRAFGPNTTNPDRPLGFAFRHSTYAKRPGRAEILHSFQDNLAFALRVNLEQLAIETEVEGSRPQGLTLSGGLVRSSSLLATMAAVLPEPLRVGEEPNATPLGAAVLTAAASGIHPSLDAALAAMVRTRVLPPPPDDLRAAYDEAFALWQRFDAAVNPLSLRVP